MRKDLLYKLLLELNVPILTVFVCIVMILEVYVVEREEPQIVAPVINLPLSEDSLPGDH